MAVNVSKELIDIVNTVGKEAKEILWDACETAAYETMKELRMTSPRGNYKGGGGYARGWRVKEVYAGRGIKTLVVWNPPDYRLTHLLENGHRIANQYRKYPGYTAKIPHIEVAEQNGNRKFEQITWEGLMKL